MAQGWPPALAGYESVEDWLRQTARAYDEHGLRDAAGDLLEIANYLEERTQETVGKDVDAFCTIHDCGDLDEVGDHLATLQARAAVLDDTIETLGLDGADPDTKVLGAVQRLVQMEERLDTMIKDLWAF